VEAFMEAVERASGARCGADCRGRKALVLSVPELLLGHMSNAP
jgi:hypothetical protein